MGMGADLLEDWLCTQAGFEDNLYYLHNKIWTTRRGENTHVSNMSTEYIMNCVIVCSQQDTWYTKAWIDIFNEEIIKRYQEQCNKTHAVTV